MKREDKMRAYEGIDIDELSASPRDREITKLYIQGMTHSAIAERYGLSRSRVGQVTDRMARIARGYRNWMEDPERLSLIAFYKDKIVRGELISISNCDRMWRQFKALHEAHEQYDNETANKAGADVLE